MKAARAEIQAHQKDLQDFPFYDDEDVNTILLLSAREEIKLYRLLYAARKGKLK